MSVWNKKTLCIVTGASQGIGRAVSVNFAKRFAPDSCIVLISRSVKGLEETKKLIENENKNVKVLIKSHDFYHPDVNEYIQILKEVGSTSYDVNILVHNAGTVGNGALTTNMNDLKEWTLYMSLNLFSVTLLTNAFLEAITVGRRVIINITSLAAVKPIEGLGYYCVGKGAREMYFNILAAENPQLEVLNYSPGPVDTDMQNQVVKVLQVEGTKKMFTSMKENSTLVSLPQTMEKLVNILSSGFKSPARIDYFDCD